MAPAPLSFNAANLFSTIVNTGEVTKAWCKWNRWNLIGMIIELTDFFFFFYVHRNYIKKDLAQFARENPQIEIVVQQRKAHHPIIRGQYCKFIWYAFIDVGRTKMSITPFLSLFFLLVNGREKVICTRNMPPNEIATKVNLLRDSSGEKLKNLTKKPVISTTESVRGIWSPFHSNPHAI